MDQYALDSRWKRRPWNFSRVSEQTERCKLVICAFISAEEEIAAAAADSPNLPQPYSIISPNLAKALRHY